MEDIDITFDTQDELVRKKPLKDEVFELLYRQIVASRYRSGDWLRQEDISAQLGVSQTPVREALDLLVSAGLAERVPFRGVRVPEWHPEEIVDAYIMRLILESINARMAAFNITEAQLKELREIVAATSSLTTINDMPKLQKLNKQLHQGIAEASGNFVMNKLSEITSNLFPDWRLYDYMFRHAESLEKDLKREYIEHCAIVDSIAMRNPDKAAAHAIIHIQNLRLEFVDYLKIPEKLIKEKERQVEPYLTFNK